MTEYPIEKLKRKGKTYLIKRSKKGTFKKGKWSKTRKRKRA